MSLRFVKIFILLIHASECFSSEKFYPILMWHSAGETCCDQEINTYTNFIKNELNQVVVRSVKMGDTKEDDFANSLSLHPFEQIEIVCNKLKLNPLFHGGYNAVGLSQGALMLRGLAQTCPFPPMVNFISLAGPHQGVNHYPRCEQNEDNRKCEFVKFKFNLKAYSYFVQKYFTPATYWHDVNEERYKRFSTFLGVINNESRYNADYVKNLQSLKRMILVKFTSDVSLIPNESSWFGFSDKNATLPMEATDVYRENKLGLQQMINDGKLIRLESPLEHIKLDEVWFRNNIIPILREE